MITQDDLEFLRECVRGYRRIVLPQQSDTVIEHTRRNLRNSMTLHAKQNPRLTAYLWVITHDRMSLVDESFAATKPPYLSGMELSSLMLLRREPPGVARHNHDILVAWLDNHRYRGVRGNRLVMLKLSLR